MKSLIHIESGMYKTLTASNVGMDPAIIRENESEYSWDESLNVIRKLDECLVHCPKYLQKRIRAQRMSFVFAFGPEMEDACKPPR